MEQAEAEKKRKQEVSDISLHFLNVYIGHHNLKKKHAIMLDMFWFCTVYIDIAEEACN